MREGRSILILALSLALAVLAPSPISLRNTILPQAHGANVSFTLVGFALTGWNGTHPGPTITVNANDVVSLDYSSGDGAPHIFIIDVNHDGSNICNTTTSPPDICDPNAVPPSHTFQFTANIAVGTYTYYCSVHATMTGTFKVNSQPTVHDAAVTGISVSRTSSQEPFAYAGIPSQLPIKINVTVANQGTGTETTMTVRAKANSTVIGTQTVTNLAASSSVVVTFSWNTTLVASTVAGSKYSNYTLSGNVTLVGDSNLSNNAMSLATPFQVRKGGDVDFRPDGAVDITDLIAVFIHQFTISKPNFYDIDNSGAVDITDLILTYLHQFT